jgi:hypothetical protein
MGQPSLDPGDLGSFLIFPYSAACQVSAAIQATFADGGAGVDSALVALSWK